MFHALASGVLIANPQRREGAKGTFATGALRVRGDEVPIISLIAFNDTAERLLELAKDNAIAVSGSARLTSWTGCDGTRARLLGDLPSGPRQPGRPRKRTG